MGLSRQTNVNDMVGVCYRLADQEEAVDKAFKHLEEASCSQTVVLVGYFKHPYLCWRGNTAGHKQARRILSGVHW